MRLLLRESDGWIGVGGCTRHHRHPHYTPAYDTEQSDQIRQTIRCAQFSVFGSASGFQDLMKDFNFPAQRILADLLNSIFESVHVKVCHELP